MWIICACGHLVGCAERDNKKRTVYLILNIDGSVMQPAVLLIGLTEASVLALSAADTGTTQVLKYAHN